MKYISERNYRKIKISFKNQQKFCIFKILMKLKMEIEFINRQQVKDSIR